MIEMKIKKILIRIRVVPQYFIRGLKYRIPICCIMSFCIRYMLGLPIYAKDGYAPCRFHRKKVWGDETEKIS